MLLEGSCHCRAVTFAVESKTPYPFNCCYCSICRKTTGGGGVAINIMGQAATMKITGEANLAVYRAMKDGAESPCQRHFCKSCGSHLWLFDPRWPDWIYPLAAAIDTDLPTPPHRVHLMLGSKAGWVPVDGPDDQNAHYPEYPEGGIQQWHQARGLILD